MSSKILTHNPAVFLCPTDLFAKHCHIKWWCFGKEHCKHTLARPARAEMGLPVWEPLEGWGEGAGGKWDQRKSFWTRFEGKTGSLGTWVVGADGQRNLGAFAWVCYCSDFERLVEILGGEHHCCNLSPAPSPWPGDWGIHSWTVVPPGLLGRVVSHSRTRGGGNGC